jgi:hypothetical protein
MWKLLRYREEPLPVVLLGDSRMMNLPMDAVERAAGEPLANLAYGGGSLREAIASFEFAEARGRLERVILGVNFNLYNAADDKDRVAEVRAILKNPLLYFANRNVMIASVRLLPAALLGRPEAIGEPSMSRERFWRYQLEVTTRVFYGNYRYPEAYHRDLEALAARCRERGIDLGFVVFPSHVDLQEQVGAYGLQAEYDRFLSDLSALAPTWNFDFPNEFTSNEANYKDPYHLTDEAMERVIQTLWGEERDLVRILGAAAAP